MGLNQGNQCTPKLRQDEMISTTRELILSVLYILSEIPSPFRQSSFAPLRPCVNFGKRSAPPLLIT